MKIRNGLLDSILLMTGFFALAQSAQGAVIANYDFDPNNLSGTQVDVDGSAQTNWTTSLLLDNATGTGAVGQPNQSPTNRDLFTGNTGNFLRLSSNREGDAGIPTGTIGESTWLTFDVTASAGSSFDFNGQNATVDTYALNTIANTSATDWTLYYTLDGGANYISLGTQTGQSAGSSAGTQGPLSLAWDLTTIGIQTTVGFLLDPQSTAQTNGAVIQRATGFDNLVINANVNNSSPATTPEPTTLLGLLTVGALGAFSRKRKG